MTKFLRFIFRPTAMMLLLVGAAGTVSAHEPDPRKWSNPVGDMEMGDPFLFTHDGKYYLTGTTRTGTGFELWSSKDLTDWRAHGMIFSKQNDAFGEKNFWAPELFRYRDRFYLAFSATGKIVERDLQKSEFRLCLAVADDITGPYQVVHAPWCNVGQSVIDAHVFIDEGKPYLFYTHVGVLPPPKSKLFGVTYGAKLSDDLSRLVGKPVVVAQATQPWETVRESRSLSNEGAFVTKVGETYFLTYSAGHYAESHYAIGYATAPAPLGPWTKSPHNPLLASDLNNGVSGPGHCCLTTSRDGRLLIVYHTHADPEAPSGRRRVNIGYVTCEGNRMKAHVPPGLPRAARADDRVPRKVSVADIQAHVLHDKIRGGLLGQMLGNLNGLPHEMRYIHEPGDVKDYTPSLPEGARTDDDTDFEWVYVITMQNENELFIPEARIAELWRERINRGIWCSNLYARRLMDLGVEPPLTGSPVLNPWAEFNISGQFLCETFGLLAPGMPQTASRIGLHYTRVAIDHEPAQTTQLFCTMIACAFFTDDINVLLDHGFTSLDEKSVQRQIITDVKKWHEQHPVDWRKTRRLLKEKYSQADGGMRDRNGYELTTGATVAALLYGEGDLKKTLRTAFNFGWDADNSAATAGTIVGVLRGYRSMLSQGWQIVDRYRNTTRDGMPRDETITSFADRLIELAEKAICEQGGQRVILDGRPVYRVVTEQPKNVHRLFRLADHRSELRRNLKAQIVAGISGESSLQKQARAAYLAICLDMASTLSDEHPKAWQRAVSALSSYRELVTYLFSNQPGTALHQQLKERATAAGLATPE